MKHSSKNGPLIFPPGISGQLYRSMQVLELQIAKEHVSFALSSCRHQAGTTTVAWNLVRHINNLHENSVVFVEANLRRPSLAGSLGLEAAPGFHEFATGAASLEEVTQWPDENSFPVITAGGGESENPWNFSRKQLQQAVSAIQEKFSIAIFDTAPLQTYPETVSIARHLDGLILILQAEHDKWEVAKLAIETASSAGVKTLGSILNKKPLYIPKWLYGL